MANQEDSRPPRRRKQKRKSAKSRMPGGPEQRAELQAGVHGTVESTDEGKSNEALRESDWRLFGIPLWGRRQRSAKFERSFSRRKRIGILVTFAVVLTGGALPFLFRHPDRSAMTPTENSFLPYDMRPDIPALSFDAPTKPVVLYLGPQEDYGQLHLDGLRTALGGSPIQVIDDCRSSHTHLHEHTYSHEHMRVLVRCVEQAMARANVIGVVGPCLEEETLPLIDAVHRCNPLVPIILETPIRRADLGQPSGGAFQRFVPGRPIYRISSGVDERGPQLAQLMREMGQADLRVLVLEEDSLYGRALHESIVQSWPEAADHASWHKFGQQAAGLPEVAEVNVVLFLGKGRHYERFVLGYRGAATVIGVMNSWVFPRLASKGFTNFNMLVDMEDLDIVDNSLLSERQRKNFIQAGFQPTAVFRDQIFSYDAGACVRDAWDAVQAAGAPTTYGALLRGMLTYLERREGHDCVSGRVTFPHGGGQNVGLQEGFVFILPRQKAVGGEVQLQAEGSDGLLRILSERK